MQRAVEAIPQSPHPSNKIAATLAPANLDESGIVTATNYWPPRIAEKFTADEKVGNSSGTLHAETACILAAKTTKNANLFITDPPCPNCAKNIAEAGIKKIYIDHKGFLKDFALRRGQDFETMSMRIFKAAGIDVYELYRKEEKIIPVLETPKDYTPVSEYPVQIYAADCSFKDAIKTAQKEYGTEAFALCIARDDKEQEFVLHARRHPAIGYTHHDDLTKEGKYSFILQPCNRLLMAARFYGLSIDKEQIFSSRVPTSRELVNMVGADIKVLSIGNMENARDEYCLIALEMMEKHDILQIQHLE